MADHGSHPSVNSSASTINPYKLLNIIYNSDDDSITRLVSIPITTPSADDPNCKDIPLNPIHKTWIRLFRPTTHLQHDHHYLSVTNNKLPLIIYFHAGGFMSRSAASTIYHNFCKSMATQVSALIVSVEYRLAPENRLPAAYDDAIDALNWVRDQAMDVTNGDPWLREYADFSKCFIMGCSAGGNIAYHTSLRAIEMDLEPVRISGLVLNQPYFGGLERTSSELQLINDWMLPLAKSDLMWELALPRGADRDHVYCNPMVQNLTREGAAIGSIRRCLVTGFSGDPLVDRQMEFVKMLEEKAQKGVRKVVSWMKEEGYHLIAHFDGKIAEELFGVMKDFIFNDDGITGSTCMEMKTI